MLVNREIIAKGYGHAYLAKYPFDQKKMDEFRAAETVLVRLPYTIDYLTGM